MRWAFSTFVFALIIWGPPLFEHLTIYNSLKSDLRLGDLRAYHPRLFQYYPDSDSKKRDVPNIGDVAHGYFFSDGFSIIDHWSGYFKSGSLIYLLLDADFFQYEAGNYRYALSSRNGTTISKRTNGDLVLTHGYSTITIRFVQRDYS